MEIVEKIKEVLLSSSDFFKKIKEEKGIGKPFIYFAILSLVFFALMTIPIMAKLPFYQGMTIEMIPIFYVISLISIFVSSGIIHLFIKLVGGKGDYQKTFKAMVYSSTPSLLLAWIPYIGPLFSLWALYLAIKGVSILHDISMGRAFLAVFLIPFILAFIISLILGRLMGLTIITSIRGTFEITSVKGITGSFLQVLRPFV